MVEDLGFEPRKDMGFKPTAYAILLVLYMEGPEGIKPPSDGLQSSA